MFGIYPFSTYRRIEFSGGLVHYAEEYADPLLQDFADDYQQEVYGTTLFNRGMMVPLGVSFVQETTDGSLTKLTIDTGTETIAFDRAAGDTFTTAGTSAMFVVAENLNGAHAALVLSPAGRAALGWNYQSFGVWEPGTETGAGATGVLSYGTPTPTGAIPASGSATYVGLLGGQYINAEGVDHILTATLTANVDFGGRSLSLQTSGTSIVSAATSEVRPHDGVPFLIGSSTSRVVASASTSDRAITPTPPSTPTVSRSRTIRYVISTGQCHRYSA